MSDDVKSRLEAITKNQKFRKIKSDHKKKLKIADSITDARFKALLDEEKQPPVDMFGRPVGENGLDNYQSSSDEELITKIPELEEVSSDDAQQDVMRSDCTDRIAIQGLNWTKLSATDIFSMISLSVEDAPPTNVTVFFSKWGESHPPETSNPPPNADAELQAAIWRKREKRETKRYFAIVTFADEKTATTAFNALKVCEIGETGNCLELSVVPSDTDFTGLKIRDTCNAVPENWTLPDSSTSWLSSTKMAEEWDASDDERKKAIDSIWEQNGEEEDEGASTLLLASSSEDDAKPTRESVSGLLEALKEEEEEDESEKAEDFEVTFTSKTAKKEIPKETEQLKKKEKKKKEKKNDEAGDENLVSGIMQDDRFTDLLQKPGFGINAADPKFKRTEAISKLMDEMTMRHRKTEEPPAPDKMEPVTESVIERIKRHAKKE